MVNILQHFEKFIFLSRKRDKFLSLADIRLIFSMGRIKSYQKGETIIKAGTINYNALIVIEGLLRAFTISSNGEEITLAFALPGMDLASPRSIFGNEPSIDNIEALKKSVVFELDIRKFEELAEKNFIISRFYTKILKKNLLMSSERILFYLTLNSEEKYHYLQKNNPEFFQQIPQKYLASYIGLTEVSFSRLKTRTTHKEKNDRKINKR